MRNFMTECRNPAKRRQAGPAATILALALTSVIAVSQPAVAQNFLVLHQFTGASDGENPLAGLTIDRAGNLYGTAFGGGLHSAGLVFKISQSRAFSVLYNFAGGTDGIGPMARVVFGPNGTLYGTTNLGGGNGCRDGCGTVFNLHPPATICRTTMCYWSETVLNRFTGPNGQYPGYGDLIFDRAGDLYGTTVAGGADGDGTVFELSPAQGTWTENILHSFAPAEVDPWSGLTFDSEQTHLYGTLFDSGTHNAGAVYELTYNGSGWDESIIYNFTGTEDGGDLYAGVIMDATGNLYGATTEGAGGCHGGTVFELSPSGELWNYSNLYSFNEGMCRPNGPYGNLAMDAAGNLYGTTYQDGANLFGTVFKLTFSDDTWTKTDLHVFTGGDDGALPVGNILLDANGNLYGTAFTGGHFGHGVVWEITP